MFGCGADGTMMGMMGYGGGMMVFGSLLALALLALTVLGIWALIVWLLNNRTRNGGSDRTRPLAPSGHGRAREVLDERYARSELTTQEYRERLEVLGG